MGQQHNLLKGLLSSSVAEWIDDLKERGDVQSRGTDPVLLDFAAWAALSVAEVFIMHIMIERENPRVLGRGRGPPQCCTIAVWRGKVFTSRRSAKT